MLEAWISPQILGNAIEPITALVDEAEIEFGKGGMRINTMDSAKVGAVSLDLLDSAFNSYESEGVKVNLDISRVKEILRRTKVKKENIIIRVNVDRNYLWLDVGGYNFELSLLSPENVAQGLNPLELSGTTEVKIKGNTISRTIHVASMFSEQMRMGVDPSENVFYMSARGETDSMQKTIEEDDLIDISPSRAYGIYSLDYLTNMVTPLPPETEVKLEFGEEHPLKFQYEIANGDGRITYGLAPRVEERG